MPAVTQPSPINKTRNVQTSTHFPKKAKVEQAVEPVVKQEVEEPENEINEDVNKVETATSKTGPKKHPCTQCEKVFTTKKSLQRHFGIHTDNPLPFSCHQCDKKFARGDKLNNHVKSAHKDNPNDENKLIEVDQHTEEGLKEEVQEESFGEAKDDLDNLESNEKAVQDEEGMDLDENEKPVESEAVEKAKDYSGGSGTLSKDHEKLLSDRKKLLAELSDIEGEKGELDFLKLD